ncbi:ATP-binding protein [Nesterenkonia halotolerans]|uniref:ATP-binding protein n=1 Tax=Nesterenkonia halotolerans TaxID=225325 RepID=UPI003EE74EEA
MSVRGRHRVLLGAAPGVGKTYAMLEEGRRLTEEGTDVVGGVIETHQRAATSAMAQGLEILPSRSVIHRGVTLQEMDLEAVLARAPQLVLVDELAHTNVPGSAHEKRWQDVQEILAAGIDVISTLNVQHIESLNDVIESITGVQQKETVPDSFLRLADQVEVIDLAPDALRQRLAAGCVYPADRINAALSNYFRLGNLTALREIALLWLADEVDSTLKKYRAENGIDGHWETRERVVVALPGGPEGETLLRRGARIAARSSGGELMALHVISHDGLRAADPLDLAAQTALVEKLGGSYHQVVGEDVPLALVEFARAVNATQLVLGVSRRGRLNSVLTGRGIGSTVIRDSGDIDVHIVTHSAAHSGLRLPRSAGALSAKRQLYGFVLAVVAWPLLSWALISTRTAQSVTSDVLLYQLLVIAVALVGGLWPALFAAAISGLTIDLFFIEPFFTITVDDPHHVLALVLYVATALMVSVVVDRAARQTRAARRLGAESQLLATVAGSVLRGQEAVEALIERTRESFGLEAVRLCTPEGKTLQTAGELPSRRNPSRIPVGQRAILELYGQDLAASERRLLGVLAAQLDAALEHGDLLGTANELAPLTATDKVRSALLSALSHDLRRPLAAATVSVGGLRTAGEQLSDADRAELLATADESLTALGQLIDDLLDTSRLQAGVLAAVAVPTHPGDVILPALDELQLGPGQVDLDIDDTCDQAQADPVLLQRVLVNLLSNATRHTPEGTRIRISASSFADSVQIRVADHGNGIPAQRQDEVFVPFQRQGDTDNTAGLGLGLALSRGFVEGMGGTLTPEDTPGGGLTMVVDLPAAGATPRISTRSAAG